MENKTLMWVAIIGGGYLLLRRRPGAPAPAPQPQAQPPGSFGGGGFNPFAPGPGYPPPGGFMPASSPSAAQDAGAVLGGIGGFLSGAANFWSAANSSSTPQSGGGAYGGGSSYAGTAGDYGGGGAPIESFDGGTLPSDAFPLGINPF